MRPRTKGETIGVQLPLAVDRWVRQRAALAECSPGLWIARHVVEAFRADIGERRELLFDGEVREP